MTDRMPSPKHVLPATYLADGPLAALPASAIKFVTNAYICAPARPCPSTAPLCQAAYAARQTTRTQTRCT